MSRRKQTAGSVRHDLDVLRRMGQHLADQARKLQRELDEAQDAGLASLRSNTAGSIPRAGSVSRPTETSAGSFEFKRIQSVMPAVGMRVSKASVRASAALIHLSDAASKLHNAWLDTDPDLAQDRRRQREEAEAFVADHTDVIYHPDQQASPPAG